MDYSEPVPRPKPPTYIQIKDSDIESYLKNGWTIDKGYGNGYTRMYKYL